MPTNQQTDPFEKLSQYLSRFMQLTPEELDRINLFFEIRKFEKKKRVINIGDMENDCNLVVKGLVRKYVMSGKKEVTLQLATEGHVIHSEISFITRQPSPVIIETIEPTTFLSIKYYYIDQLYKEMPKLEKLGRLMITDLFIKKDNADFTYLNKTTRERFLDYVNTYAHVLQRIPQKYIASYLDIKPETFSRLKHLLRPNKKQNNP